jgi:hypothetical protein
MNSKTRRKGSDSGNVKLCSRGMKACGSFIQHDVILTFRTSISTVPSISSLVTTVSRVCGEASKKVRLKHAGLLVVTLALASERRHKQEKRGQQFPQLGLQKNDENYGDINALSVFKKSCFES